MAGAAWPTAGSHSGPRSQRTGVARNSGWGSCRCRRTGMSRPPGAAPARDRARSACRRGHTPPWILGSRRTAKASRMRRASSPSCVPAPLSGGGRRSTSGWRRRISARKARLDLGPPSRPAYAQRSVVATGVAVHCRFTASVRTGRGPDDAGSGRRRLVPALIDGLDGVRPPPPLLPDLLHLVLRVRDFNLPRLGLFQHRNPERQDAVGVLRLDLLGVQGVAQDELAAEDAARPLRGNQFNVGLASDRAVQPGRSGRCARYRGPPSQR